MADVIGVISGIVSPVKVTKELVLLCYKYIGSVRDAPADLRRIGNQVSVFLTEVQSLECYITTHPEDTDTIQTLAKPDGVLIESRSTIEELMSLLGPRMTAVESSASPRGLRATMSRLTLDDLNWPRKERKVRKILSDLESFKNTTTLALTNGLARDIQVVKVGVRDLQAGMQAVNAALD
ncbi:Uu.00g001620.m01.CDS01 [Anthostomella pinea]|uniref:Uu.00g001620.m01.CDS01 n=1 Tax=Anthostomella pinea TaxID=933095 RepID=A0AAI8YIN6_9PEZI|nr:Uu.00g001620.m01.CDS01 [Anthostomella pinea]